VLAAEAKLTLDIPRDRDGSFEPQLVAKHQRRLPGFDDKVVSLYARGLPVREIQGHLTELYGLEVPPDLDFHHHRRGHGRGHRMAESVTGADVSLSLLRRTARQDPRRGHRQEQGSVLALGVRADDTKEILGIWIEQTEGAKFWLRVMTELKNRGVEDVLIAVVDGLKGFPQTINAVFPQAQIQTCIVHLIRNSLDFVGWKERKLVAAELKNVYRTTTEDEAAQALEAFAAGPWGQKYPTITAIWRRQWQEVIPFFAYPLDVRRIMYTTNAIESLNMQVRKVIKNRSHFPNDEAATKLIWLALRNIAKNWKMPAITWPGSEKPVRNPVR
jgi:putative transposase